MEEEEEEEEEEEAKHKHTSYLYSIIPYLVKKKKVNKIKIILMIQYS